MVYHSAKAHWIDVAKRYFLQGYIDMSRAPNSYLIFVLFFVTLAVLLAGVTGRKMMNTSNDTKVDLCLDLKSQLSEHVSFGYSITSHIAILKQLGWSVLNQPDEVEDIYADTVASSNQDNVEISFIGQLTIRRSWILIDARFQRSASQSVALYHVKSDKKIMHV